MKYDICYFTGTGNSLFLAREISSELESSLNSIPELIKNRKLDTLGDNIIVVFPSYLSMIYGIPLIIKDFIESIPGLKSKKIILVCSCGGHRLVNALTSVKVLSGIIKKSGGRVYNYFTLRLPMNNLDYDHIPVPLERDHDILFKRAYKLIKGITAEIKSGHSWGIGKIGDSLFQFLMKPMFTLLKKLSYRTMLDIAMEPYSTTKSIEEVFRLTDRSLTVKGNCTGCGICNKVCPVDNINIEDGKPTWLNRCEMCFACHEWCPKKAIVHWGRKEGVYYRHPEIKLQDLL